MTPVSDAVSLTKYPLLNLDTPSGQALVERCRESLGATGACELAGFVTPEALGELVRESTVLEKEAFFNAVVGNAYLDTPSADLPPNHVRRLTEPTRLGAVAYDQFPRASLMRRLYEWEPLKAFIGKVIGIEKIYHYGDPLGALNLSVMGDGDYLRWHFDQTDFVSSLMVRNADEGGHFEYVPQIRNRTDENYDKVEAVLKGDLSSVVHLANAPGSLVLFMGRYSLHRVTPIRGKTSRLIGLFGFDTQPGVVSSDHLRKIRYGRTHVLQPK